MQALKQLGGGLLLGLISLAIVIGGISLALAEGYVPQSDLSTPIEASTDGTLTLPTSDLGLGTLDFLLTPYPSDTPTPGATPTLLAPTNCPPPQGWVLIIVASGETLESIATRYKTTSEALRAANCLVSSSLLPGYGLYVPPLVTVATNTFVLCGAPAGWVQYTVQPGDTLYHVGQLYRVTVSQLQQANCLGSSITIYVGQKLWVPNVATSTLPATPIDIIFDTETPTPSETPTPTSTDTSTPTATSTATPIPPTPTPSPTPTPTVATPT